MEISNSNLSLFNTIELNLNKLESRQNKLINNYNLAKLGNGSFDESPTVMVEETTTRQQIVKNRGILNQLQYFGKSMN